MGTGATQHRPRGVDSTCLGAEVEVHDGWTVTHQDSTIQIKGEGDLRVTVAQGRYRLLETECLSKRVPIEYLCESILEMAAHVEKEIRKPAAVRIPPVLARYPSGTGR